MVKMYVRKVWSYNPKLYKFIAMDIATDQYSRYVVACIDAGFREWKTLEQWLKTEI